MEMNMRKPLAFGAFVMIAAAVFGILGATPAEARRCVNCKPIQCPPCYELVVGDCNHCPTCKRLKGCKA
jgi:hypothetical protein